MRAGGAQRTAGAQTGGGLAKPGAYMRLVESFQVTAAPAVVRQGGESPLRGKDS